MNNAPLRFKSRYDGAGIPLDDTVNDNIARVGLCLHYCSHCGRSFMNWRDCLNHEMNCPVAGAELLEHHIESIVRRVLREEGLTK